MVGADFGGGLGEDGGGGDVGLVEEGVGGCGVRISRWMRMGKWGTNGARFGEA